MSIGLCPNLADLLLRARRLAGLTQVELAERAGVSRQTVRELEQRSDRLPQQRTLHRLAAALDLSTHDREEWERARRNLVNQKSEFLRLMQSRSGHSRLPGNLPTPLNELVGREREISEIRAFLRHPATRLLTLTGPGGVGKTRLAIAAAQDMLTLHAAAVTFVDLSPLQSTAFVVPTIANALQIRRAANQSILESVINGVENQHLLLVLDNFEQVRESATDIAMILAQCPRLVVLATSRVPLHISGEQEYPVSPLAFPDNAQTNRIHELGEIESMKFFVQKAKGIWPSFALTEDNAEAVAAICRWLDGLPLAIELAAARMKTMSPQMILDRLDHPLTFLANQAQDVPERHQTIQATIEWSYNLLPAGDQHLFRNLSIFGGGWTLDAARVAVAPQQTVNSATTEDLHDVVDWLHDAEPSDAQVMLDRLTVLVNHNLVRQDEVAGEPRFSMLRTIREFGQAQLQRKHEKAASHRRHAEYFLTLAERAEPEIFGRDESSWLDSLDRELDNLRTALEWAYSEDVQLGIRLAGSLWMFWDIRSHIDEGYHWISRLLTKSPGNSRFRAKALFASGYLATRQGDPTLARPALDQALAIYQEIGDDTGVGRTLGILGAITSYEGDHQQSRSLLEKALVMFRRTDDRLSIGRTLLDLGDQLRVEGDYLRAQAYLEESLILLRQVGFERGAGWALANLGNTARAEGNFDRARTFFNESQNVFRSVGDKRGLSRPVLYLANLARIDGDYGHMHEMFEESLTLLREIKDQWRLPVWLYYAGFLAAQEGRYIHGVQYIAAAYGSRDDFATLLDPDERDEGERYLTAAQRALGEDGFWQAWAEGRATSLSEAIERARTSVREIAGQRYGELRISLLGQFRIQAGNRVIRDIQWRLRKASSLVKILAMSPGHKLHRDQIIDLLWPDLPLTSGLNNFYQALHVARAALRPLSSELSDAPILRLSRQVLSINPSIRVWVDVTEFEHAARRARETGDPDDYHTALELYQDDLLPEDLYDDWTAERRTTLRETAANLMLQLAWQHESNGGLHTAIDLLRRAIEIEPLIEYAHQRLMILYARLGRRRQALRQFQRLRQLLNDELGVEPDEVSAHLVSAIQRNDPEVMGQEPLE